MKVSVIIAVYNTEQYLPECLDSLLRQSYQDWEAWCVDDCSTDGSLKVLNEYAAKDPRFHVKKMQENGGQAKARNAAIKECDGDLIAFLDSDDWLGDDALQLMTDTFCKHPSTDCVLWDCQYVYPDRKEAYPMTAFEVMTGKEAFVKSLNWKIHGVYVTTAKLHKKHLFDETAKWFSDDNATRLHYLESREVRTCRGVYYYRQHKDSVSHAVSVHHFDILDANDSMRSQLRELEVDEKTLTLYEEVRWRTLLNCYFYSYVYRPQFTTDERREINERMQRFFEEADFKRLPKSLTRKFGCSPVGGWWWLFQLQEELYFNLRGILRRNNIAPVLLLTLMLCLSVTGYAQDMSKMSPYVRNVAVKELLTASSKEHNAAKYKSHNRAMTALVKTDGDDDQVFAEHDCRCLAHWDDIHVVRIPLDELSPLSQRASVKRIETKERHSLNIDTVRIINNVKQAHEGIALPQAFTGHGVVMGIQDIGFDLTHPTFYSTDGSTYRVQRFWDMLDVEDMDLTIGDEERELIVGKDFTSREEILTKAHATDGLKQTHGTHTAGIAAGSGFDGTGEWRYVGMAPDADLCLVANAVSSDIEFIPEELDYLYTAATDILGFKYIFDYAESVGKPCVISFSEGSHEDLYGECQLLYEALERMTGPGRIIVASAGNEGVKLTYLHKWKYQDEETALLYGSKNAYYTLRGSDHYSVKLTFCNNDNRLADYTYSTADIIQMEDSLLTDTVHVNGYDYYITLATYPSCYDESQWATELLVQTGDETVVGSKGRIVLTTLLGDNVDVEAFGSGGQFTTSSYFPDYNQARSTHNVHFPSSAPSVICVGNSAWVTGHYNYRGEWKNSDAGINGVRATSSSTGPTMTGLTKPDVMAPGMNVISAYSSFYLENNPDANDIKWDVAHFEWNGRTYPWNSNSGTSMSAPVVGGIVALWLEACPTLTPEDVMETIKVTSRHCVEDMDYPNNEYGYGEIDAYAGLLHVLQFDRIKDITTSKPAGISIRPGGNGLDITTATPTEANVELRVYNIKGGVEGIFTLQSGNDKYHVEVNLQPGIYAVQCKSINSECTGSELIRINK